MIKSLTLALLGLVLIVSGCSLVETPEDRFLTTQDAFIFATQMATDAYTEGSISTEDWEGVVLPLILEGDSLLDEYATYVETGEVPATLTDKLSDIARKLKPFIFSQLE